MVSIFGLIVVYTIVWWVVFFAVLPVGVQRDEAVEPGHDPGAPRHPMLWRKAFATTAIATFVVGSVWLLDDQGWIDFRSLIHGEGR